MIKKLFLLKPDFQGRQVLSFHYKNGFIFIRYHRYIFSSSGKDVKLQELGPRVTLRLFRIYEKIPINFFEVN
jgi:ribosome production factor 1